MMMMMVMMIIIFERVIFCKYWKVHVQILFCQQRHTLRKQYCQHVFSVSSLHLELLDSLKAVSH